MTDVVVVGAGIVGLAAAYEVTRLGYTVTIVDANHQGRATDAGAGIVNPLDLIGERSTAERERVELRGADYYRDLLAELADDGETDHGYAGVGQVVVATNDAQDAVLERLSARLSSMDAGSLADYVGTVQRLSTGEAAGLVPYLLDGAHALLLPGIARVDGRRLSACLASALRKRGADFRPGMGELVTRAEAVIGVRIDGEQIDTDRVIAAPGAWSATQWPSMLGDAITPIRGQIVHLSYPGGNIARTPVVSNIGGPYILAFEPDRVVTGATHEDVGFDYRVTAGGLAEVLNTALRFAPGLAGATMLETRVGFRPVSRDGLPMVGPIPGITGAVLATGLGAHGLTLGPAVGAIAARIAVGMDPGHDLTALRPDRFSVEC
ncbi:MAG TPA: FAD-binding oxidoreductase [Mycobacteriales bacterium]|jgi:D-amino-acid dehydrogenase|nr:FAD-binding oxidoreductase [Mycobacteriales bacterium]